jgi:hypothetical protein
MSKQKQQAGGQQDRGQQRAPGKQEGTQVNQPHRTDDGMRRVDQDSDKGGNKNPSKSGNDNQRGGQNFNR